MFQGKASRSYTPAARGGNETWREYFDSPVEAGGILHNGERCRLNVQQLPGELILVDTSYTAVCNILASTNVPYVLNTSSKFAGSIVGTITNLTAAGANRTIECTAVHD